MEFVENTPTRNSTQTICLINITLLFQMTKIVKGESRGKRKSHFRFDYAEPHPIFVFTKIVKLAHIRMDFAGIMQTVGNKGRYAGLLYIHPLRGFDLFSRS